MASMEPLCQLAGSSFPGISKSENLIIESLLFEHIRLELKNFFIMTRKEYFEILNIALKEENEVIDKNFILWLIEDILSTEQYNLQGIAHYTGTPEEEIQELYIGRIMNPSVLLFRRIIELHKSVRPALYREIMKKIASIFT